MSASCDWPSGIPTSLSSFPLQEGLVLTPTCRALHSSVSPEAPTPVLGEQHVISRIFLQSGVQMGYDGLENPLFCLKVKEFPQRPCTGFQFLRQRNTHS